MWRTKAMGPFLLFLIPLLVMAQSSSGEVDKWLDQGKQLVTLRRLAEALAAFDRAKQATPEDSRPYFYSGITLVEQGQWMEAKVELKEAVRRKPDDMEYALAYADALSKLGETTAAVDALSKFEKKSYAEKLSAEKLWFLADLYYRLQKFQEALDVLTSFEARSPADARVDLRRGQIHLVLGELDLAKQFFQRTIERTPSLTAGYFGLGLVLWVRSELAASKEALLKAVDGDPANYEYLYHLGMVLLALNQPAEAVEYLKRAENSASSFPEIYQALGKAYREAGDNAKGKKYLDSFQRITSLRQKEQSQNRRARALIQQAEQELQKGAVEQARTLFQQVLKDDAENIQAHIHLARIYIRSGYDALAYQHLAKVEQLVPDSPEGNYLMAEYWYGRKDLGRAEGYAERAKALWPGHAELRNLRGNIYLSLGQRDKAAEEYAAAVRLDPERPEFRKNLEAASRKP